MKRKLYEEIAATVQARLNCIASDNAEWLAKHSERLEELAHRLPSGSGFDEGTKIDLEKSNASKLVFDTSFHHMDEAGGYDGWTYHTITITPSFIGGFDLRISGRDRNDIKDYIGEVFGCALAEEVELG